MNRIFLAVAALIDVALGVSPAAADTLRDALLSTYRANPTLNAQRQALLATEAALAIARAAGRPQVSATVGANRDLTRSGVLDSGGSKGIILSSGIDLSLPLFSGGRVRNSIAAAGARVEAGRSTLKAVEGDVFAEAVAAYVDVIRDRAIVGLSQNQVRVLSVDVVATNAMFVSGDFTRTDIAQSEARLSLARSQLAGAEAQLTRSEEDYRRIIGRSPDELAPPPPLPPLPATAVEAVRIALADNPDLIAVMQQARAARFDVRVAGAGRLPTLSGMLTGDYVNDRGGGNGFGLPRSGSRGTIGLDFRIPFFQGGGPAAQIRQAQALEGRLLEQTIGTERAVIANAESQFATYQAAKRAIDSYAVAVAANELALEGARVERSIGTRSVIDVLNAEQELLNSRVELLSARRDVYVAGFQLLNTMGQAEAFDLGLMGDPLSDPPEVYRRTANNWSDWANEPRYQVRSTRTATSTEHQATKQEAVVPVVAQDIAVAKTVTPSLAHKAQPEKPTAVESRGWYLQLGAFRVPGAAQALYKRLSKQVGGKQPTYSRVGDITRLRVGPYPTRDEAQRLCQALNASNTPCMVIRIRT